MVRPLSNCDDVQNQIDAAGRASVEALALRGTERLLARRHPEHIGELPFAHDSPPPTRWGFARHVFEDS